MIITLPLVSILASDLGMGYISPRERTDEIADVKRERVGSESKEKIFFPPNLVLFLLSESIAGMMEADEVVVR
jgi:hypothetical protein